MRTVRPLLLLVLLLTACTGGAPTAAAVGTSAPLPPETSTPGTAATSPPEDAAKPLSFVLPTPGAEPVSAWRPPLYPSPWAPTLYDHFYFARPIAADEVNWPLPSYRYGGMMEGMMSAHTGVDIAAPHGTEVIAAGPGTVTWSGWGFSTSDPGQIDDPYGKAVVIRHDFGYQGELLFTVYAHLSETHAVVGQWVDTGELIGYVGDTGMTTGPHLHFEVRLGENGYFSTRNPELWLVPPQGYGVLVLRVMDTARQVLSQYALLVDELASGRIIAGRTYGNGTIIPDTYYRENLVLSDLPAGLYRIHIPFGGLNYETEVQILPGQVTFISFQGYYGFDPTPPATPVNEFFITPGP